MRIHFIDETAFDIGGVYREWYSCLFKEIFKEEKIEKYKYIRKVYIHYPNIITLDKYFGLCRGEKSIIICILII